MATLSLGAPTKPWQRSSIAVILALTFSLRSAGIAAVMMEHAFDYLDAPVARVAGIDVPMPYAANLEKLALPQRDSIVSAARDVCYRS